MCHSRGAAYLGDNFPAPKKHRRYSLLNFIFWPVRVQTKPLRERYLLRNATPPTLDLGRWPLHPESPVADEDRTWSVWREATRWCLFGVQAPIEVREGSNRQIKGTNLIPEVMMAEVSRRFNLTFKTRGGRSLLSFTRGNKMRTTAPPHPLSFWHSHNMTAVSRWLDEAEAVAAVGGR